MQAHEQVQFLEAVSEFVQVQVARAVEIATAPLLQKIAALQFAIEQIPAGKDGRDGDNGPPGQDGKDGADGLSVDAESVNSFIKVCVDDAVSRLPVPAVPVHVVGGFIDRDDDLYLSLSNGESKKMGRVVGRDGKDVDTDALNEALTKSFREEVAKIPPPKDGKDGKDGRDGFGFEDIAMEH